jgi:hypothetical protein
VAKNTQGHQCRVNSVQVTVDIPTRINIKKRRERVVYKTLTTQDNVNIAYAISNDISIANNLSIADRSTALTQNRIPDREDVLIETTKTLTLNVDKFLVTDIFTEDTPTRPASPLFFVHTLGNFNPSLVNWANMTLLSLEFADDTLSPKNVSDYLLDIETGEVFNNLENQYNDNTGLFNVTHLKYTVRVGSGPGQRIDVYHELLNNEPVFSQATFNDVDSFGNLLPGSKKYIINEQVGGEVFEVTLPIETTYAYKERPESRITLVPPPASDISSPWHVRATNGQFITSLQTDETTFLNHKYRIAEFNAQTFQPFPPYKFQSNEEATWLNKNLIKVAKNLVNTVAQKLYITISIFDRAGDIKYAYSTNPELLGVLVSDSDVRYTEGILSVDQSGGFIEVLGPLRSDDRILVSYYTVETEYEFTSIDFNPINNRDILTQRIALYVTPETQSTGSLDRSLYYLVIDSLGRITYNSQAHTNSMGLDPATQRLIAEDFDVQGRPKHDFFYDIESTESGLDSRAGSPGARVEEFSFLDKYTVESVLLNSPTVPSGTRLENFQENARFLVLGDIYVGESHAPDTLEMFDIRRKGGGIKDDFTTQALNIQPEVNWYWDFNSRKPYPSVGAFLAQVPQTLLKEHGGRFTRDEITGIVRRHMKFGGYAVTHAYGLEPTIIETTASSGEISFFWPSYGEDVEYNVYLSNSLSGPFELQTDDEPLHDVASGNWYTASGLTPVTKYYVQVEALYDRDTSRGPTVSIITTANEV